jgi:hypothetical protein
MIWLLVVAFCVALQPFELGFSMDDWGSVADVARHGAPFGRVRFDWILQMDPSRPMFSILHFVFSSLLAGQPLLWQSALLAANLSLALLLARVIWTVGWKCGIETRSAAVAVGSAWLLLPWAVGFRFWAVVLSAHMFLLAFAWMLAYLTDRWQRGRAPLVIPGLLYPALCLGYEVYYFQFFPVILLGLSLVVAGRARIRHVLLTGASLVAAQGLAAAWYVASKRLTGTQRPIAPAWQAIITGNFARIIPEMLRSLHEVEALFVVCAVAAASLCVYAGLRSCIDREQRTGAGYVALAAASCITGGLLSIVAFSLGARSVDGLGVETRTFSLFSFWIVVAAGILAGYARARLPRVGRIAMMAVGIGLGVVLAMAHLVRLNDWATAWHLQEQILAEAPVERIAATEEKAIILTVSPYSVNGAPVFAAPWDLIHAMELTHPRVPRRKFMIYNPWLGTLTWDGKQLSYASTPPQTVEFLYVWNPEGREFHRAVQPFRVNQDMTVVPR